MSNYSPLHPLRACGSDTQATYSDLGKYNSIPVVIVIYKDGNRTHRKLVKRLGSGSEVTSPLLAPWKIRNILLLRLYRLFPSLSFSWALW